MNKKTFSQFVNHLEGFTQRIIIRYPDSKEFIEQEKREMLEKFPQLGQTTPPPQKQIFEMVKETLHRSINVERRKCYHSLDQDVKRETPEDCINSLNLLSRAIGNAHKDILYYSALQGEILKTLKELCSPGKSYECLMTLKRNIMTHFPGGTPYCITSSTSCFSKHIQTC